MLFQGPFQMCKIPFVLCEGPQLTFLCFSLYKASNANGLTLLLIVTILTIKKIFFTVHAYFFKSIYFQSPLEFASLSEVHITLPELRSKLFDFIPSYLDFLLRLPLGKNPHNALKLGNP